SRHRARHREARRGGSARRDAAAHEPRGEAFQRELGEKMTAESEEHVLNAQGQFDIHDEPIDLSHYRFENWIAFGIFWVLALVIFYQFFTRYALNYSASWTEEISRYLLIVTVFVGAAINVRKNTHIQVDFLYRFLPP